MYFVTRSMSHSTSVILVTLTIMKLTNDKSHDIHCNQGNKIVLKKFKKNLDIKLVVMPTPADFCCVRFSITNFVRV